MLITFEGIEGSGKTTQIEYVVEFLNARGHDCVATREPGATLIGRKIREILLNPANNAIAPLTELLLYEADRAQHFKEVVRPALNTGRTVVCDRFFDATMVYQGYARGGDLRMIRRLHEWVTEGIRPDLTFLLDLPPKTGLQRAWKQVNDGERSLRETRFENEKLSFHERVRSGYLELAQQETSRFRIVDASRKPEAVREEIFQILSAV